MDHSHINHSNHIDTNHTNSNHTNPNYNDPHNDTHNNPHLIPEHFHIEADNVEFWDIIDLIEHPWMLLFHSAPVY